MEGEEDEEDASPPVSRTLVVCYTRLAHMLQYLLTTQATMQIWIENFGGDFAALARLQGLCSTFSSLVAFAVGPALGSLTDTVGRKPVLYLPPLFDLVQRMIVIPFMTVPAEVIARTVFGGVVAPLMGVFDAALGDLHVSQPMVLGTWQSRMSLAQTAAAALMPMLSSYLAGLDLRLPFIVSAGRHSVLLPILLRSYSYDDIVYTSCRQQSI
jgi:MFS family permease